METVKDEEGKDKIVWSEVEPRTEWARLDKDNNLVHLDMDLCAQGPANVYTALAIGVWNAAVKAEREACAKTKAGKPRELKPVGRGMLLDEQQFCFDKGWREGAASVRAAIRNRGNT